MHTWFCFVSLRGREERDGGVRGAIPDASWARVRVLNHLKGWREGDEVSWTRIMGIWRGESCGEVCWWNIWRHMMTNILVSFKLTPTGEFPEAAKKNHVQQPDADLRIGVGGGMR